MKRIIMLLVALLITSTAQAAYTWSTEVIYSSTTNLAAGWTKTAGTDTVPLPVVTYLSTVFDNKDYDDSTIVVVEKWITSTDTVRVQKMVSEISAVPIGVYTRSFLRAGNLQVIDSLGVALVTRATDSVGLTYFYPSIGWNHYAQGTTIVLNLESCWWNWRPRIYMNYSLYCQAAAVLNIRVYLVKRKLS